MDFAIQGLDWQTLSLLAYGGNRLARTQPTWWTRQVVLDVSSIRNQLVLSEHLVLECIHHSAMEVEDHRCHLVSAELLPQLMTRHPGVH